MNKVEARAILKEHMARYAKQSYQELLRLLEEPDNFQTASVAGELMLFLDPAGAPEDFDAAPLYQIEVEAVWNQPGESLWIIAYIDDGWTACSPLTDSFAVWPDGIKR